MPDYRIRILVDAQDRASGPLNNVGSALGNIAQIAAGGVFAQGISSAIGGIVGAGRAALDSVMGYERMGASLEALLAKEIRNASGVEQTIKVGQERLQLTEKEIAQLGKLRDSLTDATLSRDTLTARINEQKERIRQLTEKYGENGLVVIKERAELAQMENSLAKTGEAIDKYGTQIDALEAKNGKLVDVTQKVVAGQLSMTEALALAGPKAADLLQWTEKLAILSPFTSEDIAKSLRQFMNFNMGSEMAKRLTQDLVDMAAATGKTGDSMGLISYALGQINASDKLLMQDLRQLISAGVDVQGILKKMGFSLSDVGDKAIDSQQFLKIFMTTLEEDFGGAAERSANSLAGLVSSLDEIKDLALRDVFTGMFDAAKPVLTELVSLATSPEFRLGLQSFGKSLGEGLTSAIAFLQTTVLPALAQLAGWFQTQGVPAVQNFVATFGPQFGAGLQQLVVWIQQLATMALPLLAGAFQWATQNMQIVGPALGVIAFALGMLIAPLTTLIAAVVVLATAWANNWGGIQEKTAAVWAFLQPVLAGIGAFLLEQVVPAVAQFAGWLQTVALPALMDFAAWLGPLLVAGAQGFIAWLQSDLLPALSRLGEWIKTVVLPALAQFGDWFMVTALPAIQGFAAQIIPLLQGAFAQVNAFITTQALPALMRFADWFTTTAVPAIQSFAAQVVPLVQGALAQIGPFVEQIGGVIKEFVGWVTGDFATAIGDMVREISTAAKPTLEMFGGWINETFLPAVQQLANWLGPILQGAFAGLSTAAGPDLRAKFSELGLFITETLIPALTKIGVWIFEKGLPALGELANKIGGAVNEAVRTFANLWGTLTKHFENAVKFLGELGGNLNDIAGKIQGDVGAAFTWFNDFVLSPLQKFLDDIVSAAESFLDLLGKIGEAINSIPWPDFGGGGPLGIPIPGMAGGGPIRAGEWAMVGERGPELFMPRVSGAIVPNSVLRGLSGGSAGMSESRTLDLRNATIHVYANNAREFWDSMQAFENGVDTERRFIG